MARHSKKTRERAREFYLTGELTSITEIARQLKVKAHTIGRWRKANRWERSKPW